MRRNPIFILRSGKNGQKICLTKQNSLFKLNGATFTAQILQKKINKRVKN